MASAHVKSCLLDLNLHPSQVLLEQTESSLKAEAMFLFSLAITPSSISHSNRASVHDTDAVSYITQGRGLKFWLSPPQVLRLVKEKVGGGGSCLSTLGYSASCRPAHPPDHVPFFTSLPHPHHFC